jgi:hypothetical protein
VLHDSQGFEAGEVENFNKVKSFIDRRRNMPQVKDRLHAVWYVSCIIHPKCPFDVPMFRLCLLIPRAGGRLIESGDEEFLKLPFGDSMFCASVCFCAFM